MKRRLQRITDKTVVALTRYVIEKIRHRYENVNDVLWRRAIESSADFIEEHLNDALVFRRLPPFWDLALSRATHDGLFLEFGVFRGKSINFSGRRIQSKGTRIYGFDSFEGLAEDWRGTELKKGAFDVGGKLPKVPDNVTLVKGWFDQTLPKFLEEHPGKKVSYLHLDADTYESTALVLDLLGNRVQTGTVIVFDEYQGYPNWKNGEFLAWKEFYEKHNLTFKYLGFCSQQAALIVT